MLTLRRKAGQRLKIGDDIEIVIRETRSGWVEIGIIAPDHVPVYRSELYEKIKAGTLPDHRQG